MEPLKAEDPRMVGRYTLAGRLGAGGMGAVFLGLSPAGRRVAVKLVHPALAADPVFRNRFRHEVAAARKVSGAYTAAVVDAGDGDSPWLATALVMGPSLADAVSSHGPLSEVALWRLAAGLAEALGEVHSRGLVHRDLKPSNVMLADDGPRVIDFGIARALDGTKITSTGSIIGTAEYMSPEQARGEEAGPGSDVFSFGSVLTFAGTGEGPFGSGDPAAMVYKIAHGEPVLAGLPGTLAGLVRRCLAKRPEDRVSLAEMMETITASMTLADVAGSFWPAPLADVIDSHRARLTSDVEELSAGLPGRAVPAAARLDDTTVSGSSAVPRPLPSTQSLPGPGRTRRPAPRWLAVTAIAVIVAAAAATAAFVPGGLLAQGSHRAASAVGTPVPAISRPQAGHVLQAFTTTFNRATAVRSDSLLAAVETGTSYQMDTGSNRWYRVSPPSHSKNWATASLAGRALYIPLEPAAAYPRWFVAKISYALQDSAAGPTYILFTQASKGASWKAAHGVNILASPAPAIAEDKNGYAKRAPLAAARLSAAPSKLPASTARFLDGSGTAITDLWASDLGDRSDQQFWRGHGFDASHGATNSDTHSAVPGQVFALRTTDGGALVFYSLTATLTLAKPDGVSFQLKIPGYYTYATSQTSAEMDYIDQFAAYDPPHGAPDVIAQSSGPYSRG